MFKLQNKDWMARRWEMQLARWIVQTPAFMPIATVWSVKLIEPDDLIKMWADIILSNTYHLHLRPWDSLIKKLWWLWKFMNWKWPILTDSWWFQVFSLTKLRKITEEWVEFNSHISGEKIKLTPEKVVEIQENLWVDIAMVLDECAPYPCEKEYALKSLERTTRWAERCLNHHDALKDSLSNKDLKENNQKLFAIVQWSIFEDLRKMSAEQLTQFNFDWFAIWWLAVWESNEIMYKIIDSTIQYLPEHKPRYLMWVWTPTNILEAVERWVDMFDCVLPTRNARHWKLYTSRWEINIKNAKFIEDLAPIDNNCDCSTCKNYSRSYLRHLFSAKEMLWMRLATIHNLHYYLNLMRDIRQSIEEKRFQEFKNQTVSWLVS